MTTTQLKSDYSSFQTALHTKHFQSLIAAIKQKDISQIESLLEICLSFVHWDDLDFIIKPISQYADEKILAVCSKYPFLFQQHSGRIIFYFIQYGNLQAIQYLQKQSNIMIVSNKNMSDMIEQDKTSPHFLLSSIMHCQFHIADYLIEQGLNINHIKIELLLTYKKFISDNINKISDIIYYLYSHVENKPNLIETLSKMNISHIDSILKQYILKEQLDITCDEKQTYSQIKL